MRSLTERPSASEISVTLHRFGRNRRLVLMLEWLTLWPTSGPLAVSSQRRDMAKNPLSSPDKAQAARQGVQNHVHFKNRGRIGCDPPCVKRSGPSGRLEMPEKA